MMGKKKRRANRKKKRQTWKKRPKWKHYGDMERHHLHPKSRGGNFSPENILLIDQHKHKVWHELFGLMTLGEVISFLQRLQRCKKFQRVHH